jgi:uncharacterized protein
VGRRSRRGDDEAWVGTAEEPLGVVPPACRGVHCDSSVAGWRRAMRALSVARTPARRFVPERENAVVEFVAHDALETNPNTARPQASIRSAHTGLRFDRYGRLRIETDGDQPIPCNNRLLVADPKTARVKRFLVGPRGCELTGIAFSPDHRAVFINIQHPGRRRHTSMTPCAAQLARLHLSAADSPEGDATPEPGHTRSRGRAFSV